METITNKILELKDTMTELKNSIKSFNSRLDKTEESVNSDRWFEIIQLEELKENKEWKRVKKAYGTYGKPSRKIIYTL